MKPAAPVPAPPLDLRDACVEAAREAIAAHGVEQLSLRDVARRLGVSHQAPYRHYPSRDHLLAEVMRRCFERFAQHLDRRERSEDPARELLSLGQQYLGFAAAHPLEYRLMFSTPWPGAAEHADLIRDALHTFDILRQVLARVHGAGTPGSAVDLDALFIWSTVHGLAGVMSSNAVDHLRLDPALGEQVASHVLERVGHALQAGAVPTGVVPKGVVPAAGKTP